MPPFGYNLDVTQPFRLTESDFHQRVFRRYDRSAHRHRGATLFIIAYAFQVFH